MDNFKHQLAKEALLKVESIAIVGASSNQKRDSFKVMKNLISNNYKIFPVNPYEKNNIILGQKCYSDIEEIEEDVDMIDIFRSHEAILGITRQAIKIRSKVLWMQEGIIHQEAASLAERAGLIVVMDMCPKKILSSSNWTTKSK